MAAEGTWVGTVLFAFFQVFCWPPHWSSSISAALGQEQHISFYWELSSPMPQIHPQISTCAKMGTGVSRATLSPGAAALPSPGICSPKNGLQQLFVWVLTTSENNLFGSSLLFSFPPHQCWFTSPWLYVIPQMEKHRMNDFGGVCARHFAARALTYDRSG